MFFNYTVEIPVGTNISIKKIRDFHYVYYQYSTSYDKVRKMAVPKRTSIGKQCDDNKDMMYPNANYLKFFGNESDNTGSSVLPVLSSSPRSSCLKAGTYIVLKKIIQDYHLIPMLKPIIGSKYGLFLDLAVYTIISENNAAQYYPDYAYNHPLFTDQMDIYSDSTVSSFLRDITVDQSVQFLNAWNETKDHNQKIYISYDSTNKKCQAGDIDLVEVGHSKSGASDTIFNYSIGYDQKNREPLFYENYSGSITDVTQLEEMIDKAAAFGYKNIGFILDRGYFSEKNIHAMDDHHNSFIIMLKGMKALVKDTVLAVKGTFEENYDLLIPEYGVSGVTIPMKVFKGDKKNRYVQVYYNAYKAASERDEFIQKIQRMEEEAKKRIGTVEDLPKEYHTYFDLVYQPDRTDPSKKNQDMRPKLTLVSPKKRAIEEGIKVCGYFCLITSEQMNAKDALLLYKSRDDSEKLFRGDKSYLGNKAERVYSSNAIRSKIFIEFVAMIIRSRMYVLLVEQMKKDNQKYNYMTVPAAIRELEKIEIIRYGHDRYRLDHAITKTQKQILKAFGMTARDMTDELNSLSLQLEEIDKKYLNVDPGSSS